MRLPKSKSAWRVLLFAAMLFVVFGAGRTEQTGPEIPDISRRVNAFSIDLLKHHAGADKLQSNTILSPQSIFHGLAMSYIGSGGDTRKELASVFHFPEENKDLIQGLATLRQQMHKTDKHKRIDLNIANSAWLDETYADFRKEYVKEVEGAFEAPFHLVEFAHRERMSDEINAWVSEQTRGKIQKSVAPDDFMSRSWPAPANEPALVTVNAVYFKADWGSRFEKGSTRERTFHVDALTTTETPMMHQRSLLPYSENETLKFLELPYIDDLYSMYVILPKENVGISELMQGMTMEKIVALKQQAWGHEVDVLLPKFEMRSHLDVKDALALMGVKSAFSGQEADFDSMIRKNFGAFGIFLTWIHHDAWIDVHEEGTEAAAATATGHFSVGCSAGPVAMPVEFHADHPFLFMVVHNESRSILFTGWISNPEELAQPPHAAEAP